ncbi:MAG TPA: hypothetical protein P5092_20445 [Ruminococcus sp.]|nr:MAG: hypothetical protein BWZ04_02759 [Firmicutes bacterium ADurb.BinA205]HRU99781.1 hypothetical protein [Ruminococcus sp.]
MSKKAKAEVEVADESAVIITDTVLAKNNKKLTDLEQSIKAALERKHRIIVDSKLYTYGQLSELYGGAEGQALLDAVTAEHTLISKLTASGMTYDQIAELADDSSADADNSSDESYSEKYGKQMSFSETDHSYSE